MPNIYVDPKKGHDDNDGLTPLSAKRTIEAAQRAMGQFRTRPALVDEIANAHKEGGSFKLMPKQVNELLSYVYDLETTGLNARVIRIRNTTSLSRDFVGRIVERIKGGTLTLPATHPNQDMVLDNIDFTKATFEADHG